MRQVVDTSRIELAFLLAGQTCRLYTYDPFVDTSGIEPAFLRAEQMCRLYTYDPLCRLVGLEPTISSLPEKRFRQLSYSHNYNKMSKNTNKKPDLISGIGLNAADRKILYRLHIPIPLSVAKASELSKQELDNVIKRVIMFSYI